MVLVVLVLDVVEVVDEGVVPVDVVVGSGVAAPSPVEHAAATTAAPAARKPRRESRGSFESLVRFMTRMLETGHGDVPVRPEHRGMKLDENTTAVVIGGGGGVGRGTALGLASRSVRLVIADIEPANAEVVASELRDGGADAIAVAVDATDESSLVALADAAQETYGAIHVLSNNVGIVVDSPLVESTEEQWGWAVEFNLMSIVRACRVFVPHIRAHGGGGHVINTASMAALFASKPEEVGGVHLGIYTTTKHAVLGYTETLRAELAGDGIGVSCFCPGSIDSNLMATSMRNRPDRYGGPATVRETRGLVKFAMAQEEIGPYVVAAIEENRPHVLTHPKSRRLVDRRHRDLVADFDFFEALGGD